MPLWSAKTAECIEVLFRVRLVGPQGTLLDRDHDPPVANGGGSALNAAFAKLLLPLV